MKNLTSFQELDALGEGLARDYMMKRRMLKSVSFDIEGFVTEYLKAELVFENIAEDDKTKLGFLSDGKTRLLVSRNNDSLAVLFPKDTIVIDRYLLQNSESSKRRFLMAHEAAHLILTRHVPMQTMPWYRSEFDKDAEYSFADLKRMLSMNETMANRLAAAILMPSFLLAKVLKKHNKGKVIIIYDGGVLSQNQKIAVQNMADDLGVSFSALINRFRELDMLDIRPIGEYAVKELGVGDMTWE